jgi:hypothetical protein
MTRGGEMFAFRRAIVPGNPADAGLGYDFFIVEGRKTWCIDVKASLDDSEEFVRLVPARCGPLLRGLMGGRNAAAFRKSGMSVQYQSAFLPNPFARATKGRLLHYDGPSEHIHPAHEANLA